jgi:hypothetical protein
MAEAVVQLPPNSTGQQVRFEKDGGNSQMPAGTAQEVVTLGDDQGSLPGDRRGNAIIVQIDRMDDLVNALDQVAFLLMELVAMSGGNSVQAFSNYVQSKQDNAT